MFCMPNLTAKELSALEDQLTQEVTLVKKYRAYSSLCTDPILKSTCNQIADRHQKHFDTLMSHLS